MWWQTCIHVTSKFNPAEITPSIGIFGRVGAENSAAFFFFFFFFFCGASGMCVCPSFLNSIHSTFQVRHRHTDPSPPLIFWNVLTSTPPPTLSKNVSDLRHNSQIITSTQKIEQWLLSRFPCFKLATGRKFEPTHISNHFWPQIELSQGKIVDELIFQWSQGSIFAWNFYNYRKFETRYLFVYFWQRIELLSRKVVH